MHNNMLSVLTQQNKFSPNHRMGEAGRDLRSSGPRPLLKQDHVEQAVHDHIQMLQNISKDGDSTASMGNLCQCLVTFTFAQKMIPDVQTEPSMCQFVPISSGSVTKQH